jgi:hypothetical protein
VNNFDYAMVKFLLPRYHGSTDQVLAELLTQESPAPLQMNGGKYFSLALDRRQIMELLMPKAGDAKAVRQNLPMILAQTSSVPEAKEILTNLNSLCGAEVVSQAGAKLAQVN